MLPQVGAASKPTLEEAHYAAFSLVARDLTKPEKEAYLRVLVPFEDRSKRSIVSFTVGGKAKSLEKRFFPDFNLTMEIVGGVYKGVEINKRKPRGRRESGNFSSNEEIDIMWAVAPIIDAAYEDAGETHADMPRMYRVISFVLAAETPINNAGLESFFYHDFPDHPPYSSFVEAYDYLGCPKRANAINVAARSFGMKYPELDKAGRRKYIDKNMDETTRTVKGWPDDFWKEPVWEQLATYVYLHPVLREHAEKQIAKKHEHWKKVREQRASER